MDREEISRDSQGRRYPGGAPHLRTLFSVLPKIDKRGLDGCDQASLLVLPHIFCAIVVSSA
jgi:hypothetical protein